MIPTDLLSIDAHDDSLAAANALAERLESDGFEPHVMKMLHGMTGLAMIHVHHDDGPDEVVLVHPSEQGLRQAAGTYQAHMMKPVVSRLATPATVPPDVAVLFDPTTPQGSLVDACTRALLEAGFGMDTSLVQPEASVAAVVAAFQSATGEHLDPDGGIATLAAIDTLVTERLRPTEEAMPEEALLPGVTIFALAFLAAATVARMSPGATLGRVDETYEPGGTLADAKGLPAVGFRHGVALQVGRKVALRYFQGAAESLVAIVDMNPEAYAANAAKMDAALGLAANALGLSLGALEADGEAGMPTVLSLVDGKVLVEHLMAEDTRHAQEMFQTSLDSAEREAAVLVVDAYAQDPADGKRYDALLARVVVPGVHSVELTVPYVVADGSVTLPHQVQMLQSFDHRYTVDRVRGILTQSARFDDVRTDFADAAGELESRLDEGAAAANTGLAQDEMERLTQLCGLAPFAAFMTINPEGGGNAARSQVFGDVLFADDMHPMVQATIGALDLDPNSRFELLLADPELRARSLAALGWFFSQHPDGAEARAAFMDLNRAVLAADDSVDEAVLTGLEQELDAGTHVALQGRDPFGGEGVGLADLPADLLEPLAHGPVAAFLFVAAADGQTDASEVQVFLTSLLASESTVLQQIFVASETPLQARVERLLSDRNFLMYSLQTLATAFHRVHGGEAAREELLRILVAVGEADGDFDAEERAMVDALRQIFTADPTASGSGVLAGFPPEILEPLAHGPIAAFLFVAAADGQADPAEVKVFVEAFLETKSELLREIFMASSTTFEERLKALTSSRELIGTSLQALAAVFQQVPGGIQAKNELLRILVAVGEADGDFDARERHMVDQLGRLFDGRELSSGGNAGGSPAAIVFAGVVVVFLVLALLAFLSS